LTREPIDAKRRQAAKLVDKGSWVEARQVLHELVIDDGERDLIGILANVTKECGAFDDARELYEQYRTYAQSLAPELRPDVELQVGHLYKAMGDLKTAMHHYALARNYDYERQGHLPEGATSNRELRACMNEIYTCFWNGKSN